MAVSTRLIGAVWLKTAQSCLLATALILACGARAWGAGLTGCSALGSAIANLQGALSAAQAASNGGLGNQMWGQPLGA